MTARQAAVCCEKLTHPQLKGNTDDSALLTASLLQSHAVLRSKSQVMDEHFDRAPGAGRNRNIVTEPGLVGSSAEIETKSALFNQREPLRQPRTAPPFADNITAVNEIGTGGWLSKHQRHRVEIAEILQLMAVFRNYSMQIDNTAHTRGFICSRILRLWSKQSKWPAVCCSERI